MSGLFHRHAAIEQRQRLRIDDGHIAPAAAFDRRAEIEDREVRQRQRSSNNQIDAAPRQLRPIIGDFPILVDECFEVLLVDGRHYGWPKLLAIQRAADRVQMIPDSLGFEPAADATIA